MKDKYFIDSKEENFVDRHTTPVNPPPGHLPFESALSERSSIRNNIPEETPNEELAEDTNNEDAENKNKKTSKDSWHNNPPNQDPLSNL